MLEEVPTADVAEPSTGDGTGKSDSRSRQRARVARFWWAIMAVYGFTAFFMFDQIEEDTFIYFRTAANIANGAGYVFNAGGEHIETGSSLCWQYLLAIAHFLSLDLVLFVKFAGIALGACTLYLLLRLSAQLIETTMLQLVPAALLTVSIPFYFWVHRGLETSLYTFSIVLLGFVLTHERWNRYWYVPTLLVVFSRSEGFVVLAGLAGFAYFERTRLRQHVPGVAIVLTALLGSEVWRFFYFHDLVPHAFYLKIMNFPGMGAASVRQFFWESRVGIVVLIAAFGMLSRKAWTRSLVVLAVLDFPFFWWAYRTGAGTNNNRHLVPALPLIYLVMGRGLDSLVVRLPYLVHPVGFGLLLYAPWLLFEAPALELSVTPKPNPLTTMLQQVSAHPTRYLRNLGYVLTSRPRPMVEEKDYGTEQITANSQYLMGDFLARTYPKGISVVYDQMGQTSWYAGVDKKFYDTFGLTYKPTAFTLFNEQVGWSDGRLYKTYRGVSERLISLLEAQPSRHWTTRNAVDHFFSLNPDLFVFVGFQVGRYLPDGTYEYFPGLLSDLVKDPRMEARYVRRNKWFLWVYERKDLKVQWDPKESWVPGKADKIPP